MKQSKSLWLKKDSTKGDESIKKDKKVCQLHWYSHFFSGVNKEIHSGFPSFLNSNNFSKPTSQEGEESMKTSFWKQQSWGWIHERIQVDQEHKKIECENRKTVLRSVYFLPGNQFWTPDKLGFFQKTTLEITQNGSLKTVALVGELLEQPWMTPKQPK